MKNMFRLRFSLVVAVACSIAGSVSGQVSGGNREAVEKRIDAEYGSLFELYKHLHAHPELSFMEKNTAARIAAELRKAGLTVTRNVGGHGVVGVMKNGNGPTVLVRCDLDGLPVKENTGLPFASQYKMTDEQGNEVHTMHACGHDIHMTSFVGAARVLAGMKDRWKGTLVMIGQPAEERGGGAKAMLADGLFERFPLPDFCVALHVSSAMPAGMVGYAEGFALANVDSVDIKIFGVGGHGAYPQSTKDPVLLAAQTIVALQAIVSREIAPIEPAVVTVGSIHGGTKHNVIPEEVDLQLTVRSYSDETREKLLNAIKRIARGQAVSAGLPEDRMPVVTVKDEYTPSTYNDPALTRRLVKTFKAWLGEGNAVERQPVMGGEDFGRYGRTKHKVPIFMFWLGAVSPESVKRSIATGGTLPSLHSSIFAPDAEPTIKTGVTAMSAAVLELLGR